MLLVSRGLRLLLVLLIAPSSSPFLAIPSFAITSPTITPPPSPPSQIPPPRPPRPPLHVVSPFDSSSSPSSLPPPADDDTPLDLTLENVEAVLDTMRPYLQADGGNVKVIDIDGPVVRLELVGECGTCPSSTQTMKMGLEKKLKERIPEISDVIQSIPTGPDLTNEQVNVVLESVRPFLAVAGGSIDCVDIQGIGSTQPTVLLKMEGASASLKSVKLEIQQRIQRHFVLPGLKVNWD